MKKEVAHRPGFAGLFSFLLFYVPIFIVQNLSKLLSALAKVAKIILGHYFGKDESCRVHYSLLVKFQDSVPFLSANAEEHSYWTCEQQMT